jgi:hypothetical protein
MTNNKIKKDILKMINNDEHTELEINCINLRKDKDKYKIIISIGTVSGNLDTVETIRTIIGNYAISNNIAFSTILLDI